MAGILLNRSRQVPAEETPAFGGIAERFRRGGDLDRAIALCRDGLKRFPDQLSARVTLGWSLLDKGQYDLARAELEQVLRKAPDNLAAIRGLAELHDRTEGTIAAEDERSWRSQDAAAASAASAEAAVAVQSSAEVLHTAAEAEQVAEAAAADFEAATLSLGPIELEDAAAASMAAADPTPFFVVAPSDVSEFTPGALIEDTAPVPFEVHAHDAVVEAVEIETPDAAALSAAMLEGLALEAEASAPAVLFDDSEVAALAALAREAVDFDGTGPALETAGLEPASPWQVDDAASELLASSALGDGVLAGDTEVALEPLFSVEAAEQAFDVASSTAPEGLDDIDELAGLELADAIRALEEASKRVESRLAPQPLSTEPATAPEDIASYDFGPDSEGSDEAGHDGLALLDTRQDGSFELVSPDSSDLAFVLETADPEGIADGPALASADASSRPLDFEALESDELTRERSVAVDATDLSAGAPSASDAVAEIEPSVEQIFGDAESDDAPGLANELVAGSIDAVETAELSEPGAPHTANEPSFIEYDLSSGEQATTEIEEVAGASDRADITAAVEAADDVAGIVESARDAGDVAADTTEATAEEASADVLAAAQGDEEEERVSIAARENTDRVEIAALVSQPVAGRDVEAQTPTAPVSEAETYAVEPAFVPLIDLTPVVHVYDAPVFVAAAASAEVAALVATDEPVALPAMGRVQTPVRSPLAALERFLRKVQARQLELRGETVA